MKSLVQATLGICLLLAVIMFPSKIGALVVGFFNALVSIVVTVGKQLNIPGSSNTGVITFGIAMLAPGIIIQKNNIKTRLSKIMTYLDNMMKRLLTLPARLTASSHLNSVALIDETTKGPVETRNFTKAQIGSSIFLGLMVTTAAPAMAAPANKAQENIRSLINSVTSFILLLLAAAVVLMAAWGAFLFVTSAGNQKRTDMAKETIKNVFIGLAVAAAVYLIRSVVLGLIGGVDNEGGALQKKLTDDGKLK